MNKKLKNNLKKNPSERDELNFSDDQPTPTFVDLKPESQSELDENISHAANTKLTKVAMPGDEPNDDDLAPEILIKEDGARSSHERGRGKPMDQRLSIVDEDEIGGGNRLDEAELARVKPLDGKHE